METTTVISKIEIGDSVTFGTYNDEPVIWRIIEIADDKVKLLSEKILCMKAFDTAEGGEYKAMGNNEESKNIMANPEELIKYCGNNDWSLSNIRTWLNSSERHVIYADQAPSKNASCEKNNGYDEYPGFLNGFSEDEINALIETEISTPGNELSVSSTVTTKDRVFLLSEAELDILDTIGIRYAEPTGMAVKNDESTFYLNAVSDMPKKHLWLLRDPVEDSVSRVKLAQIDIADNKVSTYYMAGSSSFGIRPAIYVNPDYLASCHD